MKLRSILFKIFKKSKVSPISTMDERRDFMRHLPKSVLSVLGLGLLSQQAHGRTWKKVSSASEVGVSEDGTNSTRYVTFVAVNNGNVKVNVASSKLTFNPSTGNFTAGGNVTAYSDERLKTNWRPLSENFIANLANLKSGIYDRVDEKVTQAGVSAQALEVILPETVLTGANGIKSVAYGNAALVACVELAKEVEQLKKEIHKLKTDRGNLN